MENPHGEEWRYQLTASLVDLEVSIVLDGNNPQPSSLPMEASDKIEKRLSISNIVYLNSDQCKPRNIENGCCTLLIIGK